MLANNRPVVFAFLLHQKWYEDEAANSTGDMYLPEEGELQVGAHCAAFVGYDDSKARLIFKNSWGPTFGNATKSITLHNGQPGFGTMPSSPIHFLLVRRKSRYNLRLPRLTRQAQESRIATVRVSRATCEAGRNSRLEIVLLSCPGTDQTPSCCV